MRMCEDHKSCVFDVPLHAKEEILSHLSQMRNGEISVINELPSLVEVKDPSSWSKRRSDTRFNPQAKRQRPETNGRNFGGKQRENGKIEKRNIPNKFSKKITFPRKKF